MNYYPFHIGDYISHTSHLSDAEDLAYRRMIDLYYQTEEPFTDISTVARKVKSTFEIVSQLLHEFFVFQEEAWHNSRADEEIAKYRLKAESARNANRIKSEKKSAMKSVLKSEPNQNVTNNQEPITNIYTSEFESFWKAYQKSTGKANAFKEWKKLKPSEELIKTIISKAALQAKLVDRQYRKDAERWLRDKRWEDELLVENTKKAWEGAI